MIRKTVPLLALLMSTAAGHSTAQDKSWADVFAPDRFAELALQYALQAARGFADLTYGDLSVDILSQRARLSDLTIHPFPEWEGGEDCRIDVSDISIVGAPLVTTEDISLSLRVTDFDAPLVCLPMDMRLPVIAAGMDRLALDSLQVVLDYHVPSASLQMAANTLIPDLGSAQGEFDFEYVSYWIRDDEYPVLLLRSGTVTVEDLGGWASLRNLLPPQLLSVENGGKELASLVRNSFGGSSAVPEVDGHLERFLGSLEQAWPAFLRDGGAISLTVGDPKGEPTFIDLEGLESGQENPFEVFAPVAVAGVAQFSAQLDGDMVEAALQGDLTASEAFEVALALDRGVGVPRNRLHAREILEALAADGHLDARSALAARLVGEDNTRAYELAVEAAAAGDEEAARVLDDLERILPAKVVLSVQNATGITALGTLAASKDVAQFRSLARATMSGTEGELRSYADALVWGLLGQAMNDLESARVVRDVEARLESWNDPEAADLIAAAEARALRLWSELSP